ncbi:DEAD-domain-containing protein [Mycena filopes]|nr:DEAD-domain-containing protein [Mycena filopes]
MVTVAVPTSPEKNKLPEKTKAKQRYLKRKKQRRKNKPKTAAGAASDSEEDGDAEDVPSDDQVDADVVPIEPGSPQPEDTPRKDKRPKKRQKVVDVEEDGRSELLPEAPESAPAAPLPSLPSFPLPALPDAPSRSVLALQGLDRALVGAEIVDSTGLLPIPPEGADDGGTGLGEKTRKRLLELGIAELFAVQTSLLPFLLPRNPLQRSLYLPFDPPRDVCVSAPTGSGKTLAYVLPIVEIISTRIVTQLRALVVLPTRDLVTQVRETFEAVGKGRGLKVFILVPATGQHSFSHEQSQLIADKTTHLAGGSSRVDILICTPGRLMDHLNGTPNFSLQHLRFLVIDEADRLLAQSFQEWLVQVLAATRPPSQESSLPGVISEHYDAIPSFVTERKESSCQKLLFSATLTRDPGKLAALELRNPKYFVVQETTDTAGVLDVAMDKFTMPATLSEHMVVCESSLKPLVFFHLVYEHNVTNALVFTKSAESTARLVRLFDFFDAARRVGSGGTAAFVARAYSSDLSASERKVILDKFRAKEIQILVCSDLISRGIDISHVSHVVSYDVPVDMRKYVHRARYFKTMLKEADHLAKVKRMKLGEKELEPLAVYYEAALGQLKESYAR